MRTPTAESSSATFTARRTIGATGPIALLVVALFVATPASRSATTATVRPIVFSTAFATYSIRPDGTGWQQLNKCTLNPFTTNGRQLIGAVGNLPRQDILSFPASREVLGDCDSAGDPVRLKHKLRLKAGWWSSLDSSTASRVVAVEVVAPTSLNQHGQVVTFNANGTGYGVVTPRGLDSGPAVHASSATWSPNGQQIVFGNNFESDDCPEYEETGTVGRCDRYELVVMNADGSRAVSIYRPPQVDEHAADDLPPGSPLRKLPSISFSPFAWHRNRIFIKTHEPNKELSDRIAVVNADGSGFRFLTRAARNGDNQPALSPDGAQIALAWTLGDDEAGLYVVRSGGGPFQKVRIRPPVKSATCGGGRTACIIPSAGPLQSVTW